MEKEQEPPSKGKQKTGQSKEEIKKQIILTILSIGAVLLFWLLSSLLYK